MDIKKEMDLEKEEDLGNEMDFGKDMDLGKELKTRSMPRKSVLTCSELGQLRYPRNPNYYYVNRHPKIKPTMSLVEENYLHPKANSSTVGSSISLPPKEGSLLRRSSNTNSNRFQRFDSGVGDLEPNGVEFPMQTPRSCSPKTFQYDYAEYPTHQYEELPNKSRTFTREDFHPNNVSNVSGDIPYEDEAPPQAHEMEMTRKRFNPLYEAVTKAIPDKNSHPPSQDATHKQLKCLQLWFIIFVIFVFVCLLTILFITLFYNPSDAALVTKFRNLESKYESLELKYQRLVSFLATTEANDSTIVLSGLSHRMNLLENETMDFNSALNLSIFSLQSSLGATLQNVTKLALNVSKELQRTQLEFGEKISNISKMPGPRGPPGVGDLSRCTLQNVTDYSSDERTSTIWVPSAADLKEKVIMAGSCSTRGGQSTQLVQRDGQFRCLCYGFEKKEFPVKVCSIHLWLCPRIS